MRLLKVFNKLEFRGESDLISIIIDWHYVSSPDLYQF